MPCFHFYFWLQVFLQSALESTKSIQVVFYLHATFGEPKQRYVSSCQGQDVRKIPLLSEKRN